MNGCAEALPENPQETGIPGSTGVMIGLPGQTLEIKNRIIYLDGKANKEPDNVQYRYFVHTKGMLPEDLCHELGISRRTDGLLYGGIGV